MIISWNGTDITDTVAKVVWSGSATEAARKLEFDLISAKHDAYIKKRNIDLGDTITLTDGSQELFSGMIYFREKTGKDGTLQYTAYDPLIRMLKSKTTHNFKGYAPERIASTLCSEIGISTGDLAGTGIALNKMIDGEVVYTAIREAYEEAGSLNGKAYQLFARGGAFCVMEKGAIVSAYILREDANIIDSHCSENLESMINRVKIYDDNGNYIGAKENAEWIAKFGVMQDAYKKEKDKNANTVAESMLVGIEESATVEALGNVNCISGTGVRMEDKASGLTGVFWIGSDTHTFEKGQHTMSLELDLKEVR